LKKNQKKIFIKLRIKILFICFSFIGFVACNNKEMQPLNSPATNLQESMTAEFKSGKILTISDSTKTLN
jgi:hypothetical protein